MKISHSLPIVFLASVLNSAQADVKLPAIISDHMVLQKAAKVPVWGQADPGEEVTVTLAGQAVKKQTGADGKWSVSLDLRDSAPGPFEMTVEGKNKITVADVVVGEVWLASGQSNMQWALKGVANAKQEIAESANPLLREFAVKLKTSDKPMEDVEGRWVAAGPATAERFSAVGYFFAKKLQNEMKVPVGVVHSSWGGTPIEGWMSGEAIDRVPDLKTTGDRMKKRAQDAPAQKNAFVEAMGAWIKENGREDIPTPDPLVYAGEEVSTEDWIPVKIPGRIVGKDLPETGVVWLRRTIDLPPKAGSVYTALPINGFDSFYWNGKLVAATTLAAFPGAGFTRQAGPYMIPAARVKEGKNVIAIRLYQPASPAEFFAAPRAWGVGLDGEWLAKAERTFPVLDKEKLATVPKLPLSAPNPVDVASSLYNGMIQPLIPYAITGVIWYQGESNSGRAFQYRTSFPLLISDWRKKWDRGDIPFYHCQLANFKDKLAEPGESAMAELREAQSLALKLPNTGQAVLIDIGESGDVHPSNKKDAGERLALIALARNYGRGIENSGPVYQSMKVDSGKVVLSFTHAGSGLMARQLPAEYDVRTATGAKAALKITSPNSELQGFAICGDDKKWVWADAKIEGDTVVVWSDKVSAPVAVRYAWADNPTCNLYNGAGLPASPFRTDDFPMITAKGKY